MASLYENKVRYIMVGGFATNFHGYQRYTGDIDILIENSVVNRQRIRKAFIELNIGDYESMETMQFIPDWMDFKLNNGVRLDILTFLKGVELSFDECLAMAPVAEMEGVMVPFLHINHLIQNKKVINRPKDQVDVAELEKIKKILAEQKLEP